MKCFACNKTLGTNKHLVDTRDNQLVHVGSDCFAHIKDAGEQGYQPPLGGPRLFVVKNPNAVALGRLGGQKKSEKKTKAVRENGKKGGKPLTCIVCKMKFPPLAHAEKTKHYEEAHGAQSL